MALNNLGLGFTFTARNLASGTINRLRGQLGGLGAQSAVAGTAMRAGFAIAAGGVVNLVAGVGALSAAFSAAGAAGEFQQGLAAVGAVARASAREMGLLRDAAIQAGIATQFSPAEAVEGLTSLATAGQTATQATQTLIPVLDLAAGSLGQLGVAQAAEAVVGTLNSYGIAASEAGNVTDRLLRVTQLTNFQTRDFEAGLSKAAATGAVFGQDLNDVLITMGLLRNRNIDASSSATAFREATRRLASDQRAQQAVTEQGVDIFDQQTGEMRSIIDVTQDLIAATADQTDEQRNATIAQAFGARGLLAFNAIQNASITTMRDGVEVTLQGADAIEEMRRQMGEAEGTAAAFRDTLLDTFEGQKTLLQGTLQTFAVVLGEPFAKVFKPIVAAVVDGLNFLLVTFNEMPEGLKTAIAAAVVFGGALLTASGVVGILAGLLIVIAPFLKAIAIGFLIGIAAMLPFIAAVGAAIAVVIAFREAFQRNVGGIADFFRRTFDRIKLVFQGVMQLFSEGGFSGAVREEMNRAENQGIRRFVVNVFRIGSRIVEFFRGVREGFGAALEAMAPRIEGLVEAFQDLGRALGFVDDGAAGLADTPMNDFAETGARVGQVLGEVFGFLVDAIRRTVRFTTAFVDSVREAFDFFEPVFTALGESFSALGEEVEALFNELGIQTGDKGDQIQTFGETVGNVFGFVAAVVADFVRGIVEGIRFVVATIRTINGAVQAVGDFMFALGVRVAVIWGNMVDTIRNAIDSVLGFISGIASRIPAQFRPEVLEDVISAGAGAEERIAARNRTIALRGQVGERLIQTREATRSAEAAAIEARGQARAETSDRIVQALESQREEARRAREAQARQPIQVEVNIDGERAGSAIANADRRAGARGFVPGTPAEVT